LRQPSVGDRRQEDRRRYPLWRSTHFWVGGRRGSFRRSNDPGLVDRYPVPVAATYLAIVALSIIDGILSMVLFGMGASEVNILMRTWLGQGSTVFIVGKTLLAGSGALILAVFHRFRYFRRWPVFGLMLLLLAGYVAIVVYELVLMYMFA